MSVRTLGPKVRWIWWRSHINWRRNECPNAESQRRVDCDVPHWLRRSTKHPLYKDAGPKGGGFGGGPTSIGERNECQRGCWVSRSCSSKACCPWLHVHDKPNQMSQDVLQGDTTSCLSFSLIQGYISSCYFSLACLYNVSFENLSLPSFSKTFS